VVCVCAAATGAWFSVPVAAQADSPATGTTTLTASTTSTTYDSPVEFSASTTAPLGGTTEGDFLYEDVSNGTVLAVLPADVTFVTASLAVKTRKIEAIYLGNRRNGPDTSKSLTIKVRPGRADAVDYQIDALHDGSQTGDDLKTADLHKKWSVKLGSADRSGLAAAGDVSYPVIAAGRVFVAVEDGVGYGTTLYALDAKTGRIDWSVPSPGNPDANVVYDGRLLFEFTSGSSLTAYDAATGQVGWTITTNCGQGDPVGPPTAYDGVVYITNDDAVCAYDEVDGQEVWEQDVLGGGTNGALAVDNAGAFLSNACQEDYRFHDDGKPAWNYHQDCEGGGASTGVLHGGQFYARGATNLTASPLSPHSHISSWSRPPRDSPPSGPDSTRHPQSRRSTGGLRPHWLLDHGLRAVLDVVPAWHGTGGMSMPVRLGPVRD
jgi:outer membrane protein assembly factor BamB